MAAFPPAHHLLAWDDAGRKGLVGVVQAFSEFPEQRERHRLGHPPPMRGLFCLLLSVFCQAPRSWAPPSPPLLQPAALASQQHEPPLRCLLGYSRREAAR